MRQTINKLSLQEPWWITFFIILRYTTAVAQNKVGAGERGFRREGWSLKGTLSLGFCCAVFVEAPECQGAKICLITLVYAPPFLSRQSYKILKHWANVFMLQSISKLHARRSNEVECRRSLRRGSLGFFRRGGHGAAIHRLIYNGMLKLKLPLDWTRWLLLSWCTSKLNHGPSVIWGGLFAWVVRENKI